MNPAAYPLDPANGDQASEWNGDDGRYWASHHEVYELMLGVFDAALVAAADVGPKDRCLDVGCGTGPTTHALASRASRGSVLGLDISAPLLTIARETTERAGIENVTFVQGDAQVYPFEVASFDVAVSRMGCMFFADPRAAFTNIGRALRPAEDSPSRYGRGNRTTDGSLPSAPPWAALRSRSRSARRKPRGLPRDMDG